MKRRLTTILCADGVRYSAHMAADEDGALERLRQCRAVMEDLFAAHEGRRINTWGDAVIAEFASVVEAVRCAVAIQERVETENLGLPEDRRLRFRIGVNLGDVMTDGDDLYGDGVNVAARLQELAAPGGVVVSAAVHEFAHRQLAFAFEPLGDVEMKHLAGPVRSYAVRIDRRNAPEAPPAEPIRIRDADAFSKTGRRLDDIRAWLLAQPRGVQRSASFILFFFLVNLLFSGIATPWFIFPSLPFALHIIRHRRRLRRAGEAAEG